jgi:aryl-alcohol dehydrogenase-like predicted oxidoreductase
MGRQFHPAQVDAILDAAADCGINLIDTAECYGPDHLSEKLVGDYLSRRDRSRWIVATKFGHHFNSFLNRDDDFSVDGVRAQLEASLKALRVETIDLYQFHSGSDELFQNEKLWTMLAEQKRAGKIRHLGVSILWKKSFLWLALAVACFHAAYTSLKFPAAGLLIFGYAFGSSG